MIEDFNQKAKMWDQAEYRFTRAAAIHDEIVKQVPVDNTTRIMEFGAGTGILGFTFLPGAGQVSFVDTSTEMLKEAEKKSIEKGLSNCSFHCTDILSNPLGETFNLVITQLTLHHIDNTGKALAALGRHTATGGYLCICDLVTEDGSFHQHITVPHNGFDPEHLNTLLSEQGFTRKALSYPVESTKTVNGEQKTYPLFLSVHRKTFQT